MKVAKRFVTFIHFFRAAPSSVAAIRRTVQLHLQRGISDGIIIFLYYFMSILSVIRITLFMVILININTAISIFSLFPFVCFLHARRCCVFCKHDETAQAWGFSSLHSCKGERSNLHVGLTATTPHHGCGTHFGLSQKARLVFLLRSWPMPSFTENEACLSLCHMVKDHSQRVPHPLSPISPMSASLRRTVDIGER